MKQLLFVLSLLLLGGLFGAELSFQYQSRLLEEAENYRVYYVTYDSPEAPFWPEAKQVKAFYYEPQNVPPEGAPAVL